MKELEKFSDDLLAVAHNPDAMATKLLGVIKQDLNGDDIKLGNPTDPVAVLTEMAVMMGHACIESNRRAMPTFYPALARTFDDLYRHMSDRDMLDVFAQPADATVKLLLSYDALLLKAMPLVSDSPRKLTIPRDTRITVSGYVFTLQYPIEIRVLPYGTMQAIQVMSVLNPMNMSPERYLESSVNTLPNTDIRILTIDVPVKQYVITDHYDTVTPQIGWKHSYRFNDHFCTARVWNEQSDGTWAELQTKYSKIGYDRNTPTALITVDRNVVTVKIPEVYINTGLVKGNIRVDVYTTLGPINVSLGSYSVDDYRIQMLDLSSETDPAYYTPLKSFELFSAISDTNVSGGRGALSFEKLRQRIVDNAIGPVSLPITEKQLLNDSEKYGFTLEKAVDYVTNRIYHASTDLPASTLKDVSSNIGTLSKPLTLNKATLESCSTVISNGQRYTILPETIYVNDGSRYAIDTAMSNTWRMLRPRDLVAMANQKNYFFTPFHYVLDLNNRSVDARPYYLGGPKITAKSFLSHNETTELDVYTSDYLIEKVSTGYRIRTKTKSEKPYQELRDDQCFAQISYRLTGDDRSVAYVDGTIIAKDDGERIWEFNIDTTLDIDRNHELIVNNVRILGEQPTPSPMPLDAKINLFYGCKDYYPRNYVRSTMDDTIRSATRDGKGITHETLTLLLGKPLKRLWAASRPITGSYRYKRYEDDVYDVYERDVPEMDGKYTKYEIIELPGGGQDVRVVYKHRKGEVKHIDGEPVIKHQKGSVMHDHRGLPIIENEREVLYQLALAGFDAKYLFSDSREAKTYLDVVTQHIVTMTTDRLEKVSNQLLDETEIYYRVKSTIGLMEILRDDGARDVIPSDLKFNLRLFLTAANRRNADLIEKLNMGIRRSISEYLMNNRVISVSDIVEYVKEGIVQSAVTVEMEPMGPNADISVFTIVDGSAQANIAKRLEIAPDGTIVIKDNVSVTPTRHELS